MLKSWSWALTLLLGLGHAEEPFWQAKPKYYERVEAREIFVNVSGETHKLKVVGGGQVKAPCDAVFKMTDRAPELLRGSSYVSKVEYVPETHHLKIGLKAYGRAAEVEMELKPRPDDKPKALDVTMLSGPMKGFAGTLNFFPKGERCDVGFDGHYSYEHFPLPKSFLEFGLEVIFQKLAWTSRDVVEEKLSAK